MQPIILSLTLIPIGIVSLVILCLAIRMVYIRSNKPGNTNFGSLKLAGSGPELWKNLEELNEQLVMAGFEQKVEYDKSWRKNEFDNLKFISYSLHVQPNVEIEVTHGYFAEFRNCFNYTGTSCLLIIEQTCFEMPGANLNRIITLSMLLRKCFEKPNQNGK